MLIAGALGLVPIMLYHRLKARTGEPLDRRHDPTSAAGGPEGIATGLDGTIYGAWTGGRDDRRYARR